MSTRSPHLIQRYPLWSFFILTYALNFAVTLNHLYVVPLPRFPMMLAGALTPTIAALILSAMLGGTEGVIALLAGYTRWKVKWVWYLGALMLFGFPLLFALFYLLLGNTPPGPKTDASLSLFLTTLVQCLLLGPLAEEGGWRGFALPRLQHRHNALVSSLILGVFWAFWHIPPYLDPVHRATAMPFVIFVPIVVGLSILFTWLYNNSGGSLIITILAHFCFNASSTFLVFYFGLMPQMWLFIGGGGSMLLLTIWIVIYFGPNTLTRKTVMKISKNQPLSLKRA